MWKQKVRTGGIRRKIVKEYMNIIKSNNTVNEQQSTIYKTQNSNTFINVTPNLSNGSVYDAKEREDNNFNNDYSSSASDSDYENSYEFDYNKRLEFREKLRKWAVENNISHIALNNLAVIINELFPQILPSDARTIMCTPKQITIKNIDGGEYWHNGIANQLNKLLQNWSYVPDTISLNINLDGLPIFKSSTNEFWPILANIYENPGLRPFVIGIYFGKGKPKNLNQYLEDFVNDMKILLEEGLHLQHSDKNIKIKIRCFICDSPARAYIKGVCNFNGKHGCHKCTTVGDYSHTTHTVIFPDSNCPERTNEGFRNKIYGLHHKFESPLLNLPIDMVKQVVVGDSLHLIDLGIMKRLLVGWRDGNFGKYCTKWRASDIEAISNFLNKCTLPSEVHRTVRGLDSLSHWKASEFRSFLYYISIIILPVVMKPDVYYHFLTLYCGILICSSGTYRNLLPLAKKLLRYFVEHFKDFYGAGYVTSNVHNLLHLTDEVEMFGPLQTFNTYPFENKLYMIKRMLRTGKKPLSQVAKRLAENTNKIVFQESKKDYPFVTTNTKTSILNFKNFKLSTKKKDSYFLTRSNEIVQINCLAIDQDVISIRGATINTVEDVFVRPIKSSHLAIYKSRNQPNIRGFVVLEPKEVKCKLVCIECEEFKYFIPLLHTL